MQFISTISVQETFLWTFSGAFPPKGGGGGCIVITRVSITLGTFAPKSRRWCFGLKIKTLQKSVWYLVKQNKSFFPPWGYQPLLSNSISIWDVEARKSEWPHTDFAVTNGRRISFRAGDFNLTLLLPAMWLRASQFTCLNSTSSATCV